MELRINSCFESTRLFTQTEGRSLDKRPFYLKNVGEHLLPSLTLHFQDKAGEEPLSSAVYNPFYSGKVKDKQEKQVTNTYKLIEAKIFMEATK